MTTTKPHRVPKDGPPDANVYLMLLALHDCSEGGLDDDDPEILWACDPVRGERYEISLAVVDDLIRRGWLDDTQGYDTLSVTDKGKHWLRKFLKLNRGRL